MEGSVKGPIGNSDRHSVSSKVVRKKDKFGPEVSSLNWESADFNTTR